MMAFNGNAILTGAKRPLKRDVRISEVWNSEVSRAYGKAGNRSGMEIGNGKWKWKWKLETEI